MCSANLRHYSRLPTHLHPYTKEYNTEADIDMTIRINVDEYECNLCRGETHPLPLSQAGMSARGDAPPPHNVAWQLSFVRQSVAVFARDCPCYVSPLSLSRNP
ncbi:hypothetical protein Pcinc_025561 [Petrolisthes cinctipes]|uniref:Uncharacterized protein n=1 Tax=Petrolisthes cinctipes TaxID=88211 RepID=A0AAE1FA92_PETCI|nr:hypothetical protein Pcinc_025561 [Petrolisthes cinctipes]